MGCDENGDSQYDVDEIAADEMASTFYSYPPDCYEYQDSYSTNYSYGISVQGHTNGGSSSQANHVKGDRPFYLMSYFDDIPGNLLENSCSYDVDDTKLEPVCDAVNYYVTHDYDYSKYNYLFGDPDPDNDGDDSDGWVVDTLLSTGASVLTSIPTNTLYGGGAGLIVSYILNSGGSGAVSVDENEYQNGTGEAQEISWDIDMWGKTGVDSFPTKRCESTGIRFVLHGKGPKSTSREFYSSCSYDLFIPAHDSCGCKYANLTKSTSTSGVYPTYYSESQ